MSLGSVLGRLKIVEVVVVVIIIIMIIITKYAY